MAGVLNVIIVLVLAATVLVLALGLFSMVKGGAFNARFGNRLMRLRVMVQGAAVVLVAAALLLLAYDHFGKG
ncbi:twin transmembrane helix small protein [Shumkonia mesophila]|uniref:twin transmembrane helix small protein n=1 Tax=Shumkonia mesophila TaxID=2838854 RepID=UPI0029344362|nr:twin transmembrane helix small protein [Shumkonia mesophila]